MSRKVSGWYNQYGNISSFADQGLITLKEVYYRIWGDTTTMNEYIFQLSALGFNLQVGTRFRAPISGQANAYKRFVITRIEYDMIFYRGRHGQRHHLSCSQLLREVQKGAIQQIRNRRKK